MRFAIPIVAFVVVAAGLGAYFAFLPERGGDSFAFWVLAAGPTVLLGGLAAAWAWREDLLREWLAYSGGDFTRGLLGAVLFFALAWGFARWVAPVASTREIWLASLYGQLGDPRVLQAHAPAVAAGIAATAVAEEVLWRGAVTQLLATRVGSRTAWIWAAVAYALAFVPTAWSLRSATEDNAGLNPILVIAALGGGLLWGAMARAFGKLAPSVVAHALFDWAVLMMFPLWGHPR